MCESVEEKRTEGEFLSQSQAGAASMTYSASVVSAVAKLGSETTVNGGILSLSQDSVSHPDGRKEYNPSVVLDPDPEYSRAQLEYCPRN